MLSEKNVPTEVRVCAHKAKKVMDLIKSHSSVWNYADLIIKDEA